MLVRIAETVLLFAAIVDRVHLTPASSFQRFPEAK